MTFFVLQRLAIGFGGPTRTRIVSAGYDHSRHYSTGAELKHATITTRSGVFQATDKPQNAKTADPPEGTRRRRKPPCAPLSHSRIGCDVSRSVRPFVGMHCARCYVRSHPSAREQADLTSGACSPSDYGRSVQCLPPRLSHEHSLASLRAYVQRGLSGSMRLLEMRRTRWAVGVVRRPEIMAIPSRPRHFCHLWF